MKIIKNTSPWPYKDREWTVDVNFADDIVTVNVVTVQQSITAVATEISGNVVHSNVAVNTEFGNISTTFNLSEIGSSFVDHGAYVMLTDKHPDLELPELNPASLPQKQKTTVHDLFQLSGPTKIRFTGMQNVYGKIAYATLITPFASSTDDEIILMVRSPSNANVAFTANGFSEDLGTTISNRWQRDTGSWINLFPNLSSPPLNVGINTTTQFTVQLVDSAGEPIARSGATIYLETTGGVLTTNRIVTDANGTATGGIMVTSIPTQFKIKAGFKYFTGVIDIPVTVS